RVARSRVRRRARRQERTHLLRRVSRRDRFDRRPLSRVRGTAEGIRRQGRADKTRAGSPTDPSALTTHSGAVRIIDRHAVFSTTQHHGAIPLTETIVITSGKGGVGKTTTSASLSAGLAQRGHKTAVIDFDVGLRNLDLIMGCERRVVYDFVNVIHGEATLKQALIRDKRHDNLYVLAASQTRDKDALTQEGVGRVLDELKQDGFDYIVCDSPAGIEKGAHLAMYFSDRAVVVVNP